MKLFEFNQNIVFRIDFLIFIAINHTKFFATTFDDNVNKIRRRKFVDVNVRYLIVEHSLCEFDRIDHVVRLLFVIEINFLQINFKFVTFAIFADFDFDNTIVLIEFLLISSN